MKINGKEIKISNEDKIFFPDSGITKGDLITYYQKVADIIIHHIKDYAINMQRFPDGLKGESFYNKDTPDYFPKWIKRIKFPKKEGGSFQAPVIDNKAGLIYIANQAVITPHLYLAPYDQLGYPDKMIYDLDPPEGTENFDAVRQGALDVHDTLEELGLVSWIQTTGSKGFHIIISLDGSAKFEKVRKFAQKIALLLVRRYPDKYTLQELKKKRKGRVFIDTLRNSYGASAVSPYAVRARKNAPVATPLNWSEVKNGASPRDWTLKNIPERMEKQDDPWSKIKRYTYKLSSHKKKLHDLLEKEDPAEEESA